MSNGSSASKDSRPIHQIIYEKATFGAVPTYYRVSGDERWHPVQFVRNEDLLEVKFADGSTVYVNDSEEVAATPNPTWDSADIIPWDSNGEELSSGVELVEPEVDDSRTDSFLNFVESQAAAIASENVSAESEKAQTDISLTGLREFMAATKLAPTDGPKIDSNA